MPKSTKQKLAYQKAYNATPAVAADNVARRRASRHAIAAGTQKIGDGVDLAHKVALKNGGAATDANVKPDTIKHNRGWRKGQPGYKVPNVK